MKNARYYATDVLTKIFNEGAYSNIYLNKVLRNEDINIKDRALITQIVYGTTKYKNTIDRILDSFLTKGIKDLEKKEAFIANILRMSIYQLKYLDKIPSFAVVNEGVQLSKNKKSLSKLVNGVLRSYLREKESRVIFKNKMDELCFEYSFPMPFVKLLKQQYGIDRAKEIMEGLNEVPNVTVRVNSLKGDYDDTFNLLKKDGYEIEEGFICPEAIHIEKGGSIEKNSAFVDGKITVQDESAMLVGLVSDVRDNITVFDLCSAPGGKTTHIAELLNNTGVVKAFDIHKHKIKLINDNIKRLGISNTDVQIHDAEIQNAYLIDGGDRVLVDVPCSGIGIIRKKPEIKYINMDKNFDTLIEMQRKIIKNAAQYVKVGGYLIYSTCTLNKDENEKNIQWFLKNNKNYITEKIFVGNLPNLIYDEIGTLTILPNKYMDGFYIAKLKRRM
ncbi:16S rRNA (cytosine(967)-C(5))-methyltransferase RsmB [Clostridium sp. DL1XJH146]